MAQITITINSREYAISCEDGQELRILQLSRILDEKAKLLTDGSTQISESMLLAMVGLILADELSELKKNKAQPESSAKPDVAELQKIDNELADIIKTFDKKLKSLAEGINLL